MAHFIWYSHDDNRTFLITNYATCRVRYISKHAHLAIECAQYRVRYISKHAHLAIECAQYRVRYISKHAHLATGDSNDDIGKTQLLLRKGQKACSTRGSKVVPHPSTNRA